MTAVVSPTDMRLYVNGELKASEQGYMESNSAPIYVGYSGPFWKGRLDEMRLLSRAQTSEEVLLDYRRGYAALFSSNGGQSWTKVSEHAGTFAPRRTANGTIWWPIRCAAWRGRSM